MQGGRGEVTLPDGCKNIRDSGSGSGGFGGSHIKLEVQVLGPCQET